jgi:hypothetical protein
MDARDLQHHLCRRMGIAAVAAALECVTMGEPEASFAGPTPAMVSRQDEAA